MVLVFVLLSGCSCDDVRVETCTRCESVCRPFAVSKCDPYNGMYGSVRVDCGCAVDGGRP
jgi:hypothetical protein